MVISNSCKDKGSLLKLPKVMEGQIIEYRKTFMKENTMAGQVHGWLDGYAGTYVCSRQIWKEAFNHYDGEPKQIYLQKKRRRGHSFTPSYSKNCAAVIHFGCSISRLKKSLSPVRITSISETMAAFSIGWSFASRISFSAWSTAGIVHKTFLQAVLLHPADIWVPYGSGCPAALLYCGHREPFRGFGQYRAEPLRALTGESTRRRDNTAAI